jgi:hypothetical protein
MDHNTPTTSLAHVTDSFDPEPSIDPWTDIPLVPLDHEFNNHFQLQVDKNEFQGMRNFIREHMEPKHLNEHQATLIRKLNLIGSDNPKASPSHPYLNELTELLNTYGAPGLLEGIRLTREERRRTVQQLGQYEYEKFDYTDGKKTFGKGLKRIEAIDDLSQKCGFSPIKDSFHDVNMIVRNVPKVHGYGDYAIVDKEGKLVYLIETKNTMISMEPDFFNEIHYQEQRALGQGYKYGFLIVWPESDSIAEEYLAYNGISLVEFNKQYRLWKDRFYCRKVRMSDKEFVAPMHYQDDPIGLFRSRTVHMANAIRKICNNACLNFLKEKQEAS